VSSYFSSTIIEKLTSDNSIFVYVFVPLNVILIFCCFFGGVYLFRRSQSAPRAAWANPMVPDTGAQAPEISARSSSVKSSIATTSVRTAAPGVQIRTPTAFTPVARPK
jgi:hypothetical protein